MNAPPPAAEEQLAQARLAALGVQVDAMQAVLLRLLQDVVRAGPPDPAGAGSQLLAVNEQLVIASLAQREQAERAERALSDLAARASIDPLTRLPNRGVLVDRIEQAIAHARRQGSQCAVLFFDIDHFKRLNDSLGHAFGDEVLRVVATRLTAALREVDTASRHGGDEFLVLLTGVAQPGDAHAVADKLVAAIAEPVAIAGQTISIHASVGIALYPEDGSTVDALVAAADRAMYASKRAQRARQLPPPPHDVAAGPVPVLLRAANERLVVAALTAQTLLAAAEEARQRLLVFIATVVDELHKPQLAAGLSASMLAQLGDTPPLLPRLQAIVARQLAQMSRLLGQLLDASRLSAGGLTLALEITDLRTVVAAALAEVGPLTESRGQTLHWQAPAQPLPVRAEVPRLQQLLVNLLENASRHSHDGTGIALSAFDSGDGVVLSVRDHGVGIAPEQLADVFEPFARDFRAAGARGVGVNIALAVAHALAQAHGGSLQARSGGLGQGSEFVLTLPHATA